MKKKGDLSINTVVIAAIALVVLVVLIAIFGGRMRDFLSGARNCGTLNGECVEREECFVLENTQHGGTNCDDMNKDTDFDYVCCVPLIRKE